MNFGQAIEVLKQHGAVSRAGWNGRNMHLYLQTWGTAGTPDFINFEPCIVMFTAQGKHQPGWLASQADMLAEDWQEVFPGADG